MSYQGLIIYRTRIQKNWSQAGLCKGICTVSYLSKIETGKAEPSEEILQLLLDRLGLKINKSTEQEAAELADQGWKLLFEGRHEKLNELLRDIDMEHFRAVPAWLDLALLSFETPLEASLEPCMDTRQLALQRILQGKAAEAVHLMPNAFTFLSLRFLYKGIIIKHNKTEPTYTKTSLFLCEKRRFFMARTEKGVVTTI